MIPKRKVIAREPFQVGCDPAWMLSAAYEIFDAFTSERRPVSETIASIIKSYYPEHNIPPAPAERWPRCPHGFCIVGGSSVVDTDFEVFTTACSVCAEIIGKGDSYDAALAAFLAAEQAPTTPNPREAGEE